MNWEILSKDKYNEYEQFAKSNEHGAFMQSINWARVKDNWSNEIIVVRDESGNIAGGISVLIRSIKFLGKLMYAPRGPVADYNSIEIMQQLTLGVKALAKQCGAYKFIMDPYIMADDKEGIEKMRSYGYSITENAGFHDTIQPRYNYMLTYLKGMTADALLAKFTSGTRYYVRFGPKNGVVCKIGSEYLDDFYRIYEETGKRKKFTIRSKRYLKKILDAFGDNARLFMCYFEDKPLCGGISVQYAGVTSHVYGCSTGEMRKLNPTYMMQFEMMKWAIEGGCHTYDMQGISVDKETDEELYNVYQFKAKFNGCVVEIAGEFEIVFKPFNNTLVNTALKLREALKK